jgi:CNT family concentrative nucleoside transporter
MASPQQGESIAVLRTSTRSSERNEKKVEVDAERVIVARDDDEETPPPTFATKYRPFILGALALLILGWWISSIALPATRHRW